MSSISLAIASIVVFAVGLCATPLALAMPGQLPLGYRITHGAFPWTGRLSAIAFRTATVSSPLQMPWEAGALLDGRDPHARRLYLGGNRLDPFRWQAINVDAQATLDGIEPAGIGAARLAWLRGDLGNPALRPRDTRLASATGARVHVVPPPTWRPMQAGHAEFRVRHQGRPTTVWLGTRDGWLHGFDAVTGQELAGYLPWTMLAPAAALTAPEAPLPRPPCPRPESVDADLSGTWRTLLLCGVPAQQSASATQAGAVFALDISAPDAQTPIGLIWEVSASSALPLSGAGPVRAAMWVDHQVRRWSAVAVVAPDPDTQSSAALALLPLDRSPRHWSAAAVRRLPLPAIGCDMPASSTPLLAVTVHSAASGIAQAAYAADSAGRLWRFDLAQLANAAAASPATCMHRQGNARGDRGGDRGVNAAEAPVVVQTGGRPLVIYGTDAELSAIPDHAGPRGSRGSRGTRGVPARIDALRQGDGYVLRAARTAGKNLANGWTLSLPGFGERLEALYAASPVHLGFTTVDDQGMQRSYLVDAATGESVIVTDADGRPTPAVTGLPWHGGAAGGAGMPFTVMSQIDGNADVAPGRSSRDTFELGLWRIEGDSAHRFQEARWHRRRGRLGWRELIRTSP